MRTVKVPVDISDGVIAAIETTLWIRSQIGLDAKIELQALDLSITRWINVYGWSIGPIIKMIDSWIVTFVKELSDADLIAIITRAEDAQFDRLDVALKMRALAVARTL